MSFLQSHVEYFCNIYIIFIKYGVMNVYKKL
ncbi:hypothetical protein AAKU55_000454 [Oxalobacteraceae bacterium GrIS 1.11]